MKKLVCVFVIAFLVFSSVVYAQGAADDVYPSKPISIIVNRAAGGGSDIVARVVATYLEKYLDVTCTVINVTGGDGIVGLNQVATAEPDGYTLFVCAQNEVALALASGTSLQFDKDSFSYFGGFDTRGHMVVGKKGSPFKSFEDVVTYAKGHPGELTIGIPGTGTAQPVIDIMDATGAEFTIINSGSGNDVMVQLLGGHIDLGFPGVQFYDRLVAEGCPCFVQSSEDREYGSSEIPTLKELGIDYSYEVRMFLGGRKDLNENVKNTLNDTVQKIFKDPEFEKDLKALGETPFYLSGDEYEVYITEYFNDMLPKLTK